MISLERIFDTCEESDAKAIENSRNQEIMKSQPSTQHFHPIPSFPTAESTIYGNVALPRFNTTRVWEINGNRTETASCWGLDLLNSYNSTVLRHKSGYWACRHNIP